MNMNRYQISSPRKAFVVASIAMTAITLGLSVVVPAKMEPGTPDVRTLAPIEVVARPAHIDIVGAPEPEFTSVKADVAAQKRKQES
jgi:hypothetical protein